MKLFKLPLVLAPQPEGGYTVTCPVLPELITEGNTPEEAVNNVQDALAAVIELYDDRGRRLPHGICQNVHDEPIWYEGIVVQP